MGFRSRIIRPFAKKIARDIQRWSAHAVQEQEQIFNRLIEVGKTTAFGKAHGFDQIRSYQDYVERVPIRDYEGIKPYIERIKAGEQDVLWRGKPAYFAKTSGTTSGVKYIPISKDSIPNHFGSARNALFNYFAETGNGAWLDGKVIFLSGSPELGETAGIPTGRLSGISNHMIPAWLRTNQMPSYETNCIEDWETKLDNIVSETLSQNMTLISGIPPWVQMYYERLLERSGKKRVLDIFPNFSVFVYGGVNYEPYRAKLEELVGASIPSVETYPASEGFIAFQDSQTEPGLLLNSASGIFFEFVPADEIFNANPTRLWLRDVEPGVNYALIINNNAGLWGYSIGDTVKFVSKNPYRVLVTGRIKHFISAFGEHVIGEEVEKAMKFTMEKFPGTELVEFTVAPQVTPSEGMPLHEWFVEFTKAPHDMAAFELELDANLRKLNVYYDDLISGSILRTLKIVSLRKNAFINYMKSQGKLGGQNKVPRLSNDRKIADALIAFKN